MHNYLMWLSLFMSGVGVGGGLHYSDPILATAGTAMAFAAGFHFARANQDVIKAAQQQKKEV